MPVSTHVEPHTSGSVAGHAHVPPSQTSFVRVHANPQVPQFDGSVASATHLVSHGSGRLVGHPHCELTQTPFVWGQAFPQEPQFARSPFCRFVHTVPQLSGYGAAHWQVPPTQLSFARSQTIPQPPQFPGSVVRSEHRGFEAGQSASAPQSQVKPPAPATHVPAPHEIPHPPQCWAVVQEAGSTQNPPQSTWPEGQPSSAVPHPEHLESSAAVKRAAATRTWRVVMRR